MIARSAIDVVHRGASLQGALTMPRERPAPGVVFVHGSGPATADVWDEEARVLAEAGVAALAHDKPADWMRQSFEDRAAESVDAVRTLRALGDVDPVGLLGTSQGGWIAPLAAATSTEVAFIVCVSASGVGPREQDLYRVEHQLRADGFGEAQVSAALAAWHDRDDRLRAGGDPERMLAADEPYSNEAWYPYLGPVDPDVIGFAQLIWAFDVIPYLQRCRCPLLAIWGEADAVVSAHESRQIFERALRVAGNTRTELVVVPGADHGLRGGEIDREGVVRLIADWILTQGIT